MHTKINEWKNTAINEAVKPNPVKTLNTVKTNFAALKSSTSALYNVLADMSHSDDIIISKYASEAMDELKGNFYYVLNGDLAKYLQWLEGTISNINNKVKKRKISVQIPQNVDVTTEEITELVYALDIEYTSKVKEMYYQMGRSHVMASYFNSDGSSSLTLLSKSRYTSVLRSIGYYCKNNEQLGIKFLALLSKKTGYNFTYRYETIYIKK